jgi:hypothetical protein
MLSHTYLTFSLTLQDLDDIGGGVGTQPAIHSIIPILTQKLFISQSLFENYFQVSNIVSTHEVPLKDPAD